MDSLVQQIAGGDSLGSQCLTGQRNPRTPMFDGSFHRQYLRVNQVFDFLEYLFYLKSIG